jgi:8-oxo-dGTP pyrophosphatase MutT (NUDIX family)
MTMGPIDKLAWVRIEHGRLLCVRSRGKDAFFLPGGKREPGESDEAALLREVEEELGVALRPETLAPLHVFEAQAHGRPEGVLVRMTCFTGEYAGELRACAEIEEIAWLGPGDRARMSLVTGLIVDWLCARGSM